MDVLPAVGDSWLGLDGSRSARVQLAVDGSGLEPGDLLDCVPSALRVYGTSSRGGILVKYTGVL